jgi:hypothetical protein
LLFMAGSCGLTLSAECYSVAILVVLCFRV